MDSLRIMFPQFSAEIIEDIWVSANADVFEATNLLLSLSEQSILGNNPVNTKKDSATNKTANSNNDKKEKNEGTSVNNINNLDTKKENKNINNSNNKTAETKKSSSSAMSFQDMIKSMVKDIEKGAGVDEEARKREEEARQRRHEEWRRETQLERERWQAEVEQLEHKEKMKREQQLLQTLVQQHQEQERRAKEKTEQDELRRQQQQQEKERQQQQQHQHDNRPDDHESGEKQKQTPTEDQSDQDDKDRGYTAEQEQYVNRILVSVDYYEVLECTKQSTQEDLKLSYRRVAMKTHPDKNRAPNSVEAFKVVAEAFFTLNDPDTRNKYDLYGKNGISEEARRAAKEQAAKVDMLKAYLIMELYNSLCKSFSSLSFGTPSNKR